MNSNIVFISYSSKDYRVANQIRTILQDKHIKCWMAPESIPGGSDYANEIPQAIQNCSYFMVVLSENSQKSTWVPKELDLAIDFKKTILPVKIDFSPMVPSFKLRLSNVQCIDATNMLSETLNSFADDINKRKKTKSDKVKYYCYISRSKVDGLFDQIATPTDEDPMLCEGLHQEQIDSDNTLQNSITVLNQRLNFGATGVIQFNKKEKTKYAQKLGTVLKVLSEENQIEKLTDTTDFFNPTSNFFYISCELRVSDSFSRDSDEGYEDRIVIIESDKINANGDRLELSCSFKNFSDTRSDGRYHINSSNYFFFHEHIPMQFEVFFALLHYDGKNKIIKASPLCLILNNARKGMHL